MKFKTLISTLLGLLITFSLCSCDKSAETSSKGSDESINSSTSTQEDATINLADQNFSEPENCISFIDTDAINTDWKVLLNFPCDISNFVFYSINTDLLPSSNDVAVSNKIVEKKLYSCDNINSETIIVISTYINDTVANRGVSYIDSNGKTRYFYIDCDTTGAVQELKLVEFYIQ